MKRSFVKISYAPFPSQVLGGMVIVRLQMDPYRYHGSIYVVSLVRMKYIVTVYLRKQIDTCLTIFT